MAKSPIVKKDGKTYLELPKEYEEYDEAEIYRLKEGFLVVPQAVTIKEAEIAVIRKLLDIKFERRVPETVESEFTEAERIILKDLGKKNLVTLFKGKKYPNGVYNINADVYSLIKGKEEKAPQELQKGFLTINDKNEAFRLSKKYAEEMKSGDIIGIKGFDGKFYVVTKEYFDKTRKEIEKSLHGEMGIKQITDSTKLDFDGVTAVIRLMAENGDILEKKRGVFVSI